MQEFTGRVSGPALLFVHVDWCGYCQRAKPIMEQVAAATGTAVPVLAVNGDQHEQFARQLGVKSFPTIIYVDPAGQMDTFEGERTPQQIMNFVCRHTSNVHGFCRRA